LAAIYLDGLRIFDAGMNMSRQVFVPIAQPRKHVQACVNALECKRASVVCAFVLLANYVYIDDM